MSYSDRVAFISDSYDSRHVLLCCQCATSREEDSPASESSPATSNTAAARYEFDAPIMLVLVLGS